MSSKDKIDPLVGLSVLKEFSDFGYFTGTVLGVDANLYRVQFTDGDVEILKRSAVIDLLMPAAPCVFSSVKLSGGSSRVVPKHFLTHRLDLEVWSKMEEAGWRLEAPGQKRPKQQNWLVLASERAKKPEKLHQHPTRSQRAISPISVPPVFLFRQLKGSFESVEKAMEFARSLPAWEDAFSKVEFSNDSDHDDDDASSQDPQVTKRALRQQRHRIQQACAPASLVSLPPCAARLIYSFSTVEAWGALGIVSRAWAHWLKRQWQMERSFPVNEPLSAAASQSSRGDQKQLSPAALLEAIQRFPSMQRFAAAACADRFGWRLVPQKAPPLLPSAAAAAATSSPVKASSLAPRPRPVTPDLHDSTESVAPFVQLRPSRSPRNASNSPPQAAPKTPGPSPPLSQPTREHDCCRFPPILASARPSLCSADDGAPAFSSSFETPSALAPHPLCAQCRELALEARYSELVSTEEFMRVVRGLQWLQCLELDASHLTDHRVSFLAAPNACPALQTLKLHNCGLITDAAPQLLAKAPFATSLWHLTLSGCSNELGLGLAALCKAARGLSGLDLRGCSALSSSALQGVRDHLQWTLRSLCLKGCENLDSHALGLLLHGAAPSAVRSTNSLVDEALPLLTKLDVSDCPKLDSKALISVLNRAPCAQNALATLWCCGLTKGATATKEEESECASLAALGSTCPFLTSLNLSGSDAATDDSVVALLAACPVLKELALDGCCNLEGKFIATLYDALCAEVLRGSVQSPKMALPDSLHAISAVGCPSVSSQAADQLRQMCDTIGRPLSLRLS